jgi:ESS family glutamate:Na+ symporter
MIVVNLIANFYFSWKIFDVDWFERAVASYGLESGVLATGLMLLRVVDPNFETTGQDSVASAVSLLYPLAIPYVVLMPLLSTKIPAWILWLFSFAIWLAFYIVARRSFWHKNRKFSDILSSKSKAPCAR